MHTLELVADVLSAAREHCNTCAAAKQQHGSLSPGHLLAAFMQCLPLLLICISNAACQPPYWGPNASAPNGTSLLSQAPVSSPYPQQVMPSSVCSTWQHTVQKTKQQTNQGKVKLLIFTICTAIAHRDSHVLTSQSPSLAVQPMAIVGHRGTGHVP